jgi:hypothetical protein
VSIVGASLTCDFVYATFSAPGSTTARSSGTKVSRWRPTIPILTEPKAGSSVPVST